jgi:hypothetical protein
LASINKGNEEADVMIALVIVAMIVIVIIQTCVDKNGFFSVRKIIEYYATVFQKPLTPSEKASVKVPKRHYYMLPLIFNFAVPIVFGIILGIYSPINQTIITFMSTVVSIWIAILFALIAVIQSMAKERLGEKYYSVVKQTYATIMFECCISVFTVILSFSYIILCPSDGIEKVGCPINIVLYVFGIIIYSLLFILLLTMFMIFKKCNALLGETIKSNATQKRDITLQNILKSINKINASLENNDSVNVQDDSKK